MILRVGYWDLNPKSRDGSGAGWGQRMEFSPLSRIVLSCPILAFPRMTGKIFFPHRYPLGPLETPPYLVKLYFLLICPQLLQFFLIELISLIKINLKLQINLSNQIKLFFSKNWIILSNCSTRQYHKKKKKKNLIVQNQ